MLPALRLHRGAGVLILSHTVTGPLVPPSGRIEEKLGFHSISSEVAAETLAENRTPTTVGRRLPATWGPGQCPEKPALRRRHRPSHPQRGRSRRPRHRLPIFKPVTKYGCVPRNVRHPRGVDQLAGEPVSKYRAQPVFLNRWTRGRWVPSGAAAIAVIPSVGGAGLCSCSTGFSEEIKLEYRRLPARVPAERARVLHRRNRCGAPRPN